MEVYCGNNYCIYWKNYICILSNISIDSSGICDSCILVSIRKEELDRKRAEQLFEAENRD